MSEQTLAKWEKWLEEAIYPEVAVLADYRYIFGEVQKIVADNIDIQKPSSFYSFIGQWYAVAAIMGIKKQLETQDDIGSLARLLAEIIETPEILSQKSFVNVYKIENVPLELQAYMRINAIKDFEQFSNEAKDHINPAMVKEDLAKLQGKSKTIEEFAARGVANLVKRELLKIPTFTELDECIRMLEELTKKYMVIFFGKTVVFPPTYQYNWQAIFEKPWIKHLYYKPKQ